MGRSSGSGLPGMHESGEDYLEAILMVRRRQGAVRAVDIAEQLDVSKASVSKALAKLEREGYVRVVDHSVCLTDPGLAVASSILERHEFFCNLLVSAGIEHSLASEEACRLEHCLCEDSFKKLVAVIGEVGYAKQPS